MVSNLLDYAASYTPSTFPPLVIGMLGEMGWPVSDARGGMVVEYFMSLDAAHHAIFAARSFAGLDWADSLSV